MAASIPSSSRSLLAQCIHPLRSSSSSSLRRVSATRFVQQSRRQLHSLPSLPANLKEGDGCEPLFSSQTVRLLWDDWHAGLLNKLNDEVRGTPWENSSIVETVIGTAQDPSQIQAFNYASMALNNSFFLNGLRSKQLPQGTRHWADSPPGSPPRAISSAIERSFDSLPAFKLAFSSAAYGMSGSGYVWLVQDRHQNMGIVPTFGAGTVLVQNRVQRFEESNPALFATSNTVASSTNNSTNGAQVVKDSEFNGDSGSTAGSSPTSPRRLFLPSSAPSDIEGLGEELFPLLCVSVHERDWLPDYGMWGKEEYLMRFWECVNWNRVNELHNSYNSVA
ncbi:manganese and iron superoxide dismutase [Meira miltonrushii]|uniref:Manganese and iron superoxide dismutase n=1 Tax=Meira miltonrushii TaxID=1280837 RepID=A0A316VD30_9BASI|nr:manganese and iron superoxide dismutase [Meira miltonrushii]PWN35577.1 manganese and iron superoxide dismutase [Meira miltonrushii]